MNAEHTALFVPADAVLAVHVAFVAFVVLGQVYVMIGWMLRWPSARNRLFRLLHLAAIGVVVLQAWLGLICPLTLLEYHMRGATEALAEGQSFIGYWLSRLLYYHAPPWVFTTVYSIFGALVLLCFFAYPPRRRI